MEDHHYPEPDEEDGYLYVREMGDEELRDEFQHVCDVAEEMVKEIEFRHDTEEEQMEITDDDLRAMERLVITISGVNLRKKEGEY